MSIIKKPEFIHISWVKGTRRSHNHYTTDGKITLCGKKIPENKAVKDFGSTECSKCLMVRYESVEPKNNLQMFKEIVAELDGAYMGERNGVHSAVWADKKNLYIAYGKLSIMGAWLTENCIYLKS